jgi:CubicO group peptidase (beta-lactamase class C family)
VGDGPVLEGSCDRRFRSVGEAFAEVVRRSAAGSAVAVWHGGRMVVDLWGGQATAGEPWTRETLVMPYSVSKPFAALAALLLVADGRIALDEPARTYWPEMRCEATVRQLLDHSAGLIELEEHAPTAAFFDWHDLCTRLARQQPSWTPGTAVGESALFYGHLIGEIVRRVDGRALGRFFRDEVAAPHDLDIHVGVRRTDLPRIADLVAGDGFSPRPSRALGNPPGAVDMAVVNSAQWRMAEVPAVNAHVTARAVAGFYSALSGGRLLPVELVAEMSSVQAEGVDAVTGSYARWGLGVAIEPDGWGMGGLGGSLGWWSREGEYALGFVTAHLVDHDRATPIENAVRSCLGLAPLAP